MSKMYVYAVYRISKCGKRITECFISDHIISAEEQNEEKFYGRLSCNNEPEDVYYKFFRKMSKIPKEYKKRMIKSLENDLKVYNKQTIKKYGIMEKLTFIQKFPTFKETRSERKIKRFRTKMKMSHKKNYKDFLSAVKNLIPLKEAKSILKTFLKPHLDVNDVMGWLTCSDLIQIKDGKVKRV